MIFCPKCDSRALPKDMRDENSKYVCTRAVCGKEFKPKW